MIYKPIRRHHKVKPKRQPWRWWRSKIFWVTALTLIICGVVTYNVLFSQFFQIKNISISGNEKISLADLTNRVTPQLSKNIFFFKTASIFLLSPAEIERRLKEEFPPLGQVRVKRKWPDSIEISVQERQAAAVWCKEPICFLIDKNGVIFEEISEAAGHLVIKIAEYAGEPSLGKQVFTNEEMTEILFLWDLFRAELQTDIVEVVFASPERINLLTSEGWQVYLNFPVDEPQWQIMRLKAVLAEEISVERRPDLEYIDLRFSKVYYRYKD